MSVILTRYGNIETKKSKQGTNHRKIVVKGDIGKFKKEVQAVKASVIASKIANKEVKLKSIRNLPRSANEMTRMVVKQEPKNTNPATKRQRVWTYKSYPAILPPPVLIRKLQRRPKAINIGTRL